MDKWLQTPITRRQVIKGAAIALAAAFGFRSKRVEAQQIRLEYVPSSLDEKKLKEHKEAAAKGVVDTFWGDDNLRRFHMFTTFKGKKNRAEVEEDLVRRSKMQIPTEKEASKIFADYPSEISELIQHTATNACAFFTAGDLQKTYVIRNLGEGRIQFEKSYVITTSAEEWSNVIDSDGTSLGLQWVARKRIGLFGEVISRKDQDEKAAHFSTVHTRSGPKLVAKSLDYLGNEHATVMSFGLELWDTVNKTKRGELMHATNREDILGQRASGGCTRVSHIDMFDALQYARESKFNTSGDMVEAGTPFMTAAKGFKPRYVPNEREKKRIAEKKAAKKAAAREEPPKLDFSLPPHLK